MVFLPIRSKQEYKFYLQADEIALGISDRSWKRIKSRFLNPIWKYERMLRQAEFYTNCKQYGFCRPISILMRLRAYRYGYKLGFEIPVNVFGAGLSIAHHGSIIVNPYAKVGENCRIHNSVTIGTEAGYGDKSPTIGDNIFIGPGVQIFGRITIANDIAIGANSVVNKSFLESGITIGGCPLRRLAIRAPKQSMDAPRSCSGEKVLNS